MSTSVPPADPMPSQAARLQENSPIATPDLEKRDQVAEANKDANGEVVASNGVFRHDNGLQDQTQYLPTRQIIIVFLALTLAVFLSFLDQTIISTALPQISAAFDSGRASAWVASAYFLTSTAVQPLWGRLSDIMGRKPCVMACVTIFAIGSLACALASSMTMLIVFRGLQGVGGGGLFTLVLICVSDVVPLRDRGKYQALNEITIAIGNGVGPVLGGVLSQKIGWRWCFWINLPLSGLALIVLFFFLPLRKVEGHILAKLKQVDFGGSLLTVMGASLIILPINWGGTSFPWISGPVLGCLFGGLGMLLVLGFWEIKIAKIPIIPASIFKYSTVNAVFLATFFGGAAMTGQTYYLPQYFQEVKGYSPILSGVLILPQLLVQTGVVVLTGQITSRTGELKTPIWIGYGLWAIALGLLSTINEHTSIGRIIGFQIIGGLGAGQTLQSTMVAAQAAVPRSEMAPVTAVRSFLRSLGGALALPIGSALINNILRRRLTSAGFTSSLVDQVIDDPTAIWKVGTTTLYELTKEEKEDIIVGFVHGFRVMFLVLVGILGLSSLATLAFIKRKSLESEDEAELKARGKAWAEAQRKGRVSKGDSEDVDVEKA